MSEVKHDYKAALDFTKLNLETCHELISEQRLRGENFDRVINNITVYETIIHALKLADKVMCPSEGFPSMAKSGAVEMWEQCKEGLIGHNQALAVFKAIVAQAEKEIEE